MSTFLTAWPRLTAIQVAVVISAAVATTVPSAFAIDFSVTSTADELDTNPGDGTCATAAGACTLRAAIQEANALPEPEIDQIIISGGPYGLSLGELDIDDDVHIIGGIIDGNGQTIFNVGPTPSRVTFTNVTLQNGSTAISCANRGAVPNPGPLELVLQSTSLLDNGIGLSPVLATLTVENSMVKGCDTGITLTATRAFVTDSRIVDNRVGIELPPTSSQVSIADSILSRNGIALLMAQDMPNAASVSASEISYNVTGIANHGAQLTLEGTTVRRNTGDGIQLSGAALGGVARLRNSTVSNNGGDGIDGSGGDPTGREESTGVDLWRSIVSGNRGDGVTAASVNLVNSTISLNGGNGVLIYSNDLGGHSDVINTTVSGNGRDGIVRPQGGDRTFIRNSTIANNRGRGLLVCAVSGFPESQYVLRWQHHRRRQFPRGRLLGNTDLRGVQPDPEHRRVLDHR
jgi:CSLREA domain-containing protein